MALAKRTREQRIDGAELYVLDRLLSRRAGETLARALARMPFRKVEADRDGTRMLGFVADFSREEIAGHPLVRAILAEVARAFPGEAFTLVRAYCNNNVYGDMAHPHRDSPRRRPR